MRDAFKIGGDPAHVSLFAIAEPDAAIVSSRDRRDSACAEPFLAPKKPPLRHGLGSKESNSGTGGQPDLAGPGHRSVVIACAV